MSYRKLKAYLTKLQAEQIRHITDYCDNIIYYLPLKHDTKELFNYLKGNKNIQEKVFKDKISDEIKTHLILNGNINYSNNIKNDLDEIKKKLNRHSRLILVTYNPYLSLIYRFASKLKYRNAPLPTTFLKKVDLNAVCKLSGYEIIRTRFAGYLPYFFGIGHFFNLILPLIPVIKWLSFSNIFVLRPIMPDKEKPSLSIVIPARNEKGNIENALKRMPLFKGVKLEIIFVEGNSTDSTWEEIQSIKVKYKDKYNISAFKQTGKGKSDAVRLGFSNANGKLLTILDADLTMPPELLEDFYYAYVNGHADFINGNRLVYKMENEAMRNLNYFGNVFFAKMLSWLLELKLGDSLCGTKLFCKKDYDLFVKWRNDFGDIDPFGDFELLFPAGDIGIGSTDVAIQYKNRSYGDTNIRRFRDGFTLLKMLIHGLLKIKIGVFHKI